jgi:hypothetical protein
MQLVAYGAQDVYLTGNPQITFFKVVYRRHTNFSMESIPQTFNGTANLGNKVTATVSRNGDLVHKMYLRVALPAITVASTAVADGHIDLAASSARMFLANNLGHALLDNVELEIGGQRIDRHYGHWMQVWNELSLPSSKDSGFARMVGKTSSGDMVMASAFDTGVESTYQTNAASTAGVYPETVMNIPLEFWFCRNPGLALPLIALQYHEVKVNIEFNNAAQLGWGEVTTATLINSTALVPTIGFTADSGSTPTNAELIATANTDLSTVDGFYVGYNIEYTSTGAQTGAVTAYVASTRTFTFSGTPTAAPATTATAFTLRTAAAPAATTNVLTVSSGGNTWVTATASATSASTVATTSVRAPFTAAQIVSPELYVDYIYLDTDERRRFAQVSHEYLIEQLQFTGSESTSSVNSNIRLNFNHPVKELVWTCQPAVNTVGASSAAGQFDYQWWGAAAVHDTVVLAATGAAGDAKPQNPVARAVLQLNGHDRFRERTGEYFNVVQPFQHHERVPADKGINVYSFGLKPEEHQPSGTANMSRIDTTTLKLTLRNSEEHTVRVYATSYNVLRVTSGMGGLAYSN